MTRHQKVLTSFAEWDQSADLLHPSIFSSALFLLLPFFPVRISHFVAPLTSRTLGSPPHVSGPRMSSAARASVERDSVGWSPEVPSKTPTPAPYPENEHAFHVSEEQLKRGDCWMCVMGEHKTVLKPFSLLKCCSSFPLQWLSGT